MKQNDKNLKRIAALFLAFFVVLQCMPFSQIPMKAATASHMEVVTITVSDDDGHPVSGASVTYSIVSKTDESKKYEGTKTTDEDGTVDVLHAEDYTADDLLISAEIMMAGYLTDTSLSNTSILSDDQDFAVTLVSDRIKGIEIQMLKGEYTGGYQELIVGITGYHEETDTIAYRQTADGEWSKDIPKEKDVGTHSVWVKIERAGYADYLSGELTAVIDKASIQDVEYDVYQGAYDGNSHPALTPKAGVLGTDHVTYICSGTESTELPYITDAGSYTVTVKIERENYKEFTKDYTAEISMAEIEGVSASLKTDLTYTGKAQKLVKELSGTIEADTVYYRIDGGDWSAEEPKRTDTGTYKVEIKIDRGANYHVKEILLDPASVTIKPYDQTIVFAAANQSAVIYNAKDAAANSYDFSVTGDLMPSPEITYTVENDTLGDMTDIDDIAVIDENGKLTLLTGGYHLKITAEAAGNQNYNPASVSFLMTAKCSGTDLISFAEESLIYEIGAGTTVSGQKAVKAREDDNGTITYAAAIKNDDMAIGEAGLAIGADTGIVTVTDVAALDLALQKNNSAISIIVTAEKTEGAKQQKTGAQEKKTVYDACRNSYAILIKYADTPAAPYTMRNPDQEMITEANGTNDWYNTAVTIVPAGGYEIAKDAITEDYADTVEFDDQGSAVRIIYLRNKTTRGITAPVTLPIEKLDSVKPDANRINIEYSAPILEKLLDFYHSEMTIQFTAYDETSGIDYFTWDYTREENASIGNLETDSGTVQAVQDAIDHTKYTASFTLPKNEAEQLRGHLRITATDKAGNTSEYKDDSGKIFVLDTIAPNQNVIYQLKDDTGTQQTVGMRHYYSNDVEFIFDIVEANFFPEDVVISVKKDTAKPIVQTVTWTDTEHTDGHRAYLTLSEEGDYVVSMSYTDRSGNEMTSYQSETIVVDKTKPVIKFSFDTARQTATIRVTEHNFRKEDITVTTDARDIAGNLVAGNDLQEYLRTCRWTASGDTHTASVSSQFVDAVYRMIFDYKDLALNAAEQADSGTFTVDWTAPAIESMSVSYSVPILEKLLSGITFGYYNSNVTVTFTAHDSTAGVSYFTWNYERQEGVSEINQDQYAAEYLYAVQDKKDLTKFTASIKLPLSKAKQLRGNLAFTATDQYDNRSEKITDDDHVIVVDSIAPEMTVEYTAANRTAGNRMYYNKDVTVIFTVNEANFYKKDLEVELSKDGGTAEKIVPSWKDQSADVHVGTYTIKAKENHSADGDYVLRVRYTDRSNNKMHNYKSKTIVVDTSIPVIQVSYANLSAVASLVDAEGHQRDYFNSTQTATVTVTEHNFRADEVDITVLAKDVGGTEFDADSVHSKSAWTTKGDVHTMTVTYPGDANYTFDIAYADPATNPAADYTEDYFTVDTSKPTDLEVSYRESVLETLIQNIAFGFYQAKAIVTITATDHISGVYGYKYSYRNAAGVSPSNAELQDQVIEAGDIVYLDGGATARATFEIPKDALGNGNQFNGTIDFDATDRAGNESDYLRDVKRIVVDSISPTANVQYNAPVQEAGGISYYDTDVTAAITINEANFYAEDVEVTVTRDDAPYPAAVAWTDNSTDVHAGSFTLAEEGDYFVTISYTDKSSNQMEIYTSEQLTIDKSIEEEDIKIMINGMDADGQSFSGEVVPAVSFGDTNLDSYDITLTRTSFADKGIDVKQKFIDESKFSLNATEGFGTFAPFAKDAENDGIYTMTVSMTDKANHSAEKSAVFTVNRYGSVYEYDDYLVTLIQEGGAYKKKVEQDLVITEYNANRLIKDSLDITITRDGKPLEHVDCTVTPELTEHVRTGNSGWYQYQYTIAKSNFESDGVYKIAVSSTDDSKNASENTSYVDLQHTSHVDQYIQFWVDDTPPEINSITGLERAIINDTGAEIEYMVYDTIGIQSVVVKVNEQEQELVNPFQIGATDYTGKIILQESSDSQKVQIIVTDLANNRVDTAAKGFADECKFPFVDTVTISTNFFVRWWANQALFWGSIGGAAGAAILAGCSIVLFFRKRRKEREA